MNIDPITCPYDGRHGRSVSAVAAGQIAALARFAIWASSSTFGGNPPDHDYTALFEVIFKLATEAEIDSDEMFNQINRSCQQTDKDILKTV